MKKKVSLIIALLMILTLIPGVSAESKRLDSFKNTKTVLLDGNVVRVGSYLVEGFNYLKLRDVAAILNGKKCQFDVAYDKASDLVSVELNKGYEILNGDLVEINKEKSVALLAEKAIMVNGEAKLVKTALIDGYNYMQLRDLGALVGLDVDYDFISETIILKSDPNANENTDNSKGEIIDHDEEALLDEEANREYSSQIKRVFDKADALHEAFVEKDFDKASDAIKDIVMNRFSSTRIENDYEKILSKAKDIGADIFKKDYKTRGSAYSYDKRYECVRQYDYGNNSIFQVVITHYDNDEVDVKFSPIKRLSEKTYKDLSDYDKAKFEELDKLYEPLIKGDTKELENSLKKLMKVGDGNVERITKNLREKHSSYGTDTSKTVKTVKLIENTNDGKKYHIIYRYANKTYTIITLCDYSNGMNFLVNAININE